MAELKKELESIFGENYPTYLTNTRPKIKESKSTRDKRLSIFMASKFYENIKERLRF